MDTIMLLLKDREDTDRMFRKIWVYIARRDQSQKSTQFKNRAPKQNSDKYWYESKRGEYFSGCIEMLCWTGGTSAALSLF